MNKFIFWMLIAVSIVFGIVTVGPSLLVVSTMGSRNVGTAKFIDTSGTSVLETGPAVCGNGIVTVPVEVVPAPDELIDRKYTKVKGTLTLSQLYVEVDAKHGVTKWGWNASLPSHYGKDAVKLDFPSEQERALRERYHVSECCMEPNAVTRPMDKCHLGRMFGGSLAR